MRRRRLPVTVLLVLMFGLAACGADEEPGATDSDAGPDLVIEGFGFHPTPVVAGATVTVENRDQAAHSVTGEGFDLRVGGGATETFTAPDTPGDYDFACTLHPAMTATLSVE
jgi:plastocyanin